MAAHRAALTEQTRDGLPLDRAGTQTNLGNALVRLGVRESRTARLEEAVEAFKAALTVFVPGQAGYYYTWRSRANADIALGRLGDRQG